MSGVLQDVRYALHALLKRPGFSSVVIVTLALGIGANTTVFSVVNAVLLRPVPLAGADRLVVPVSTNVQSSSFIDTVPYADYLDWKAQTDVFEHVGLFTDPPFDIAGDAEPERVRGASITDGFFEAIGTPTLLGRTFASEDYQPGAAKVVILSHSIWQRRYGGARDVVGKTVMLNSEPHTVIGVMPLEAQWPSYASIWVPLTLGPSPSPSVMRRDNYAWRTVARLQPDVSLRQAQARLKVLAKQVAEKYPDIRSRRGADLIPIQRFFVDPTVRRSLWVLMGSVGFVLLIVCASVANLMLARVTERSRELAIRSALGAARPRLIRQLLSESVALAVLGGVLGAFLAVWGTDLLVAHKPAGIPRLEEAGVNGSVLGFNLVITLLSGLLVGLVPAWRVSKPNLYGFLKEGGRALLGGRSQHRFRSALVISQVALSLVLLAGAGLFAQSLIRLLSVDPGFRVDNLLTFQLSLPDSRYSPGSTQVSDFFQRIVLEIEGLPGIESAAAASVLPLAGGNYIQRGFIIDGHPSPPTEPEYLAHWTSITPSYFAAMGIPLLKGRHFTNADQRNSSAVAIVNETLARKLFPHEDPIGKRIRAWRSNDTPREVVGVVRDVRFYNVTDASRCLVYVPHKQDALASMMLTIRTTPDPETVVKAVRSVVASMDQNLAIARLATMTRVSSDALASFRFITLLITGLAAAALLLTLVGIYGVISHSVSRRTHEIGIRMALGAQKRDVRKLVIKQGLMLTLAGVVSGLVCAAALSQLLSSLLYEVGATDPLTLAMVTALLTVTALIASYLPARRATKVDPIVALRYE